MKGGVLNQQSFVLRIGKSLGFGLWLVLMSGISVRWAGAQQVGENAEVKKQVELMGRVLVVRGAAGEEGYGEAFARQAELWRKAVKETGYELVEIGPEQGGQALVKLLETLEGWVKQAELPRELWVVLIGHGTFDGRQAKLNLTGEDLTPDRLAAVLKAYQGRLVMVHTGSASQPFAEALKGLGRVLVTATKSADEVFYTRFGEPFAEAIGGLAAADLDQDAQVSVLEAFLYAADAVRQFYETEERIATEHAVLDDNGDGLGVRSESFAAGKLKPEVTATVGDRPDGDLAKRTVLKLSPAEQRLTAEQREKRDLLEQQIEVIKQQRAKWGDDRYYEELEKLMLELGRVLIE